MGLLKRVFGKRLSLPLMCLILFTCLYIRQSTMSWKPFVNDNDLLRILQTLQRSQMQNRVLMIQAGESFSEKSGKPHNSSEEEAAANAQKKATRQWFDTRPSFNSSKMSVSKHPLFPGYVIENPTLCGEDTVDVLIYLHSAVEHRGCRRRIRESWASPRNFANIHVKLMFILGKPSGIRSQLEVETEFATYGDIVQGDFSDTFKNLTYKAITMLTWVNTHCPQVKYILKVDDDMFVDMFKVVSELVPKLVAKKSAVACDVKTNMAIPRDPHVKWYVNDKLLPGITTWPQFCSGYFALFTAESIPALYEASFGIQDFIPIDDAYLFGLLVERNVSLEFINIHDQISVNERPDPDKEISVNGKFEFISFRVPSDEDHTKLWTLRSKKLSQWEQIHSRFYKIFQEARERTMLTV